MSLKDIFCHGMPLSLDLKTEWKDFLKYMGILILSAILIIIIVSIIFHSVSALTEFSYGTITQSSAVAGYEGAKAFDNNITTRWDTDATEVHWIKMDYGNGISHIITRYTIQEGFPTLNPTSWTFQGSNDDSLWTTLDTQSGQDFTDYEIKTYDFSNTNSYRYYRWYDMLHTLTQIDIAEMELLGMDSDTTPPNSITGLTNSSPSCSNITWNWNNPLDSDYYQLITWKNNIFNGNLSNSTTSIIWNSLSENTLYTFSSKTKDLSGNENLTYVNLSATTDFCISSTPTPTPTLTPLPSGVCSLSVDNITQTSIVWNLSQPLLNGSYIESAYIDGKDIFGITIGAISLNGIDEYAPHIIASDLKCNEHHNLKIVTNNSQCIIYSNTLACNNPLSNINQEGFFAFINQYILILMTLGIYGIAIYTEKTIGFIGILTSFIGLTTTIHFSFVFGTIFVVLLIAGIFVTFGGE